MGDTTNVLRREALLASEAPAEMRRDFIKKTYGHLGVAILAFVALESLLVHSSFAPRMIELTLIRGGRLGWLLVVLGFVVIGRVADAWAQSSRSQGMQYLGLLLYVIAEAVIFIPLLYIATFFARYDGLLGTAALITGVVFVGLTVTVFVTRADFGWMQQLLYAGGLAAVGVLVASLVFGFTLGTLFSGAIILLAAGSILYHTSNIIHRYPIGSHVAASLALFASVATLFWYILQLLMGSRR